jgi:hypothetical protein
MVQTSPFLITNSSKKLAHHEFSPTSSPPLCSNAPCPFVDKRHQTIATSLWLNPKFCIQAILKTLRKSKAWCIANIHLVLPVAYVP